MENLYDATEAQEFARGLIAVPTDLGLRIHTSRLLGRQLGLVSHGGGNTSVKIRLPDLLGEERDVLFVKGSGHDLATIGPEGFTGLDLARLRRLRTLTTIDDDDLENELLSSRLRAVAPAPSVETLLHAFLPHRFVDHTHADAVLILSSLENAAEIAADVLGPRTVVLPYVMPGLGLARQVVEAYEAHPEAEAIVSLGHGVFTFADQAETAYSRMIDCVSRAEAYLADRTELAPAEESAAGPLTPAAARLAQVVRGACAGGGPGDPRRHLLAAVRTDGDLVEFSRSPLAAEACRMGVVTPDHVTRTKNRMLYVADAPKSDDALTKLVKDGVADFARDYGSYLDDRAASGLDPYPRVVLAAGIGMIALGETLEHARIAADIGARTLRARRVASELGRVVPIDPKHVLDIETWSLQRKKFVPDAAPLAGQVAFVTGAGGAIGAGVADRLLAAGSVVAISDFDPARLETVRDTLIAKYGPDRLLSLPCDVTDLTAVETAFVEASCRAGGVDILVPNAGIAHVARLEDLEPTSLSRTVDVNLMGTFHTIKAAIPIFRRQATGGNIVLVSSKNVPDPGAAFGAYSASKAAAHQLGKIAALELAELGVRVNMVNPDAVFGDETVSSGLWDQIGPDRMKSRGLDPEGLREYYRQRNLLKVTVLAEHVGNAVVFFASEQTPTTGASLPIDGGVPSAFPR